MSCCENPDGRVVELHRRARLLRDAAYLASRAVEEPRRYLMAVQLHAEALVVATEAAMLVADTGASHGEAYHHHAGQLAVGWATPTDDEAAEDQGSGGVW